MARKIESPPAATGGLGTCDRLAAKIHNPENNHSLAEKQDFRAAWLARRFNLSAAMAEAVASLAFNVGGAR